MPTMSDPLHHLGFYNQDPAPDAFNADPQSPPQRGESMTAGGLFDPLPLVSPDASHAMVVDYHLDAFKPPATLQGLQIQSHYPRYRHFIFGCGMFHPLDNESFKHSALAFLKERLQEDDSFRQWAAERQLAGERPAAPAPEEVMNFMAHVKDFCFWQVVPILVEGDDNNKKTPSIKKDSWATLWYKNVTNDQKGIVREKVGEVLRNLLPRALKNPEVTNSKQGYGAAAAQNCGSVAAAVPNSETMAATTGVVPTNKRTRFAWVHPSDNHENDAKPQAVPYMTEEEEDKLIEMTLKEVTDAVHDDISKLEALDDLRAFRKEVEFGIVRPRLRRLTSAILKAVKTGMSPQAWAEQWAKNLIPKDERDKGDFSVEKYLQDNRLDADRKVCVELLKLLCLKFADLGSKTVAEEFPPRHVVSILSNTLEMDRAKARFWLPYSYGPCRGVHWYAKKHLEASSKWYKEEWKEVVSDYGGRPTISKRLMWYFDEDEFGLQAAQHKKLREILEPQKACWVQEEQVERF